MTLGDVLVDSPAPAKLIRPADIFPLRKYRPGQRAAIATINAAVEARENAILSAGTGTGKSITAITAALPPVLNSKDVRCIFVARTYKENERVVRSSCYGKGPPNLPGAGAAQLIVLSWGEVTRVTFMKGAIMRISVARNLVKRV